MKNSIKTFEDYIENQPPAVQDTLLKLSQIILSAAPNARKTINYNIPAFNLIKGGKREEQIMMAGYKHHIGFYPHPTTMEHFWEKLKEYKKAKGSVQFPLSKPLPKALIIEMVKYRKKIIEQGD